MPSRGGAGDDLSTTDGVAEPARRVARTTMGTLPADPVSVVLILVVVVIARDTVDPQDLADHAARALDHRAQDVELGPGRPGRTP